MRNYLQNLKKALKMELSEHRSSFIVYWILRLLVIIVLVYSILNRNFTNVFFCLLTMMLLLIPSLAQLTFKIELPTTLEIILLLFIFAAEILGEIGNFYLIFPMWDTILHTLNGFLAGAVGYSLINILNKSDKVQFQLSPLFTAIVAFCFSMTVGVMWEFYEFSMDVFFGMDTQKDTIIQAFNTVAFNIDGTVTHLENIKEVLVDGVKLPITGYLDIGLIDTMQDLIVNFIGAITFSILGFLFTKYKGKIEIVKRFVPTMKTKNKDYMTLVEKEKEKLE